MWIPEIILTNFVLKTSFFCVRWVKFSKQYADTLPASWTLNSSSRLRIDVWTYTRSTKAMITCGHDLTFHYIQANEALCIDWLVFCWGYILSIIWWTQKFRNKIFGRISKSKKADTSEHTKQNWEHADKEDNDENAE